MANSTPFNNYSLFILNIRNISQFTSPFRSKLIIQAYKPWIKKGEKILDIGCGTGITAKMIKENLEVDAICCDIENYLTTGMPFFKIPKNGKLPLKNRSFDSAMLNDVIHHIEKSDQINIIKEALRVAKKVLIFEIEPTLRGKIFDTILNKLHYKSLKTPLAFRRKEEWIKLFKKMGLEYSTRVIKAPFWYPFSHIAIIIKEKNQ